MEGNTQPYLTSTSQASSNNVKLGPDRIFNKPVKIFKKNNGNIQREVLEKDALNIFEIVDVEDNKRKMSRSASQKLKHHNTNTNTLRGSISKDRISNIIEPTIT